MKVLMLLTSHSRLADTGLATGLWLDEFAAPYYVLHDEGIELVLASPAGGVVPIDPRSQAPAAQSEATRRLATDLTAQAQLAAALPLEEIEVSEFAGLFVPGGHGPLWDLAGNPRVTGVVEAMVEAGKPLAAVCHGVAALLEARGTDGRPLVQGRLVTGFSNAEEAQLGLVGVVPFSLEDQLRARGGLYSQGEPWEPYLRVDGLLVTGQNPASSALAAEALLRLLSLAEAVSA